MSYFRENIEQIDGYEPGFQPKDTDVVKLNTNENPYPPSDKVIEAIRNVTPEQLRRYPQPLADKFRSAAANVLSITEANIICTNGGDDLLTIAIRAFCDKERPLAYPVPSYSLYPVLAKIQNCPIIEIPFDSEFNLPPKLAEQKAGLTIICNPNAPSGTYIPVSELSQLASELKGVLLIDEAYVDFAEDNCLELIKKHDNVLLLRSMSKGYSLAGVRFGFGIACEKLIKGLRKVKDSYNVDTLAITAASAAIKDQDYFKANVAKVKAERKRLSEELGKLGFEVAPSSSNFIFVKPAPPLRALDIYEQLKLQKIFIRYWAYPEIKDFLRITIGTAEQNNKLLEAITTLCIKNKN